MKIKLITIEGEPHEIHSIIADLDLHELKSKSKREPAVDEKVPEHISGPFGKSKEKQLKSDSEPITASPVVKTKRDKICKDCGAPFHDDSKTNTRKWCNKCTCLKHKIDDKYVRQKPKTENRVAKPKPDLTQNSTEEVKPPSEIKPAVYLKGNQRICANRQCKKIFVPEKMFQDCCSDECSKMFAQQPKR